MTVNHVASYYQWARMVDVRRTNGCGRGWTEMPRRWMETDDADADGRTMNAKSRAIHYFVKRREKE